MTSHIETPILARRGHWTHTELDTMYWLVPIGRALFSLIFILHPQMARMEMANFMKNVGLLGGALLLAYFGAGPISIDNRKRVSQR